MWKKQNNLSWRSRHTSWYCPPATPCSGPSSGRASTSRLSSLLAWWGKLTILHQLYVHWRCQCSSGRTLTFSLLWLHTFPWWHRQEWCKLLHCRHCFRRQQHSGLLEEKVHTSRSWSNNETLLCDLQNPVCYDQKWKYDNLVSVHTRSNGGQLGGVTAALLSGVITCDWVCI